MGLKLDDRTDKDTGLAVIRVDGEFNIYVASQTNDDLKKLTEGYQDVELDLSEVEEFDSTGVQILLAMRRHFAALGGSLKVTAKNDSISRILDTYAIGDALAG